MSIGIFLAIIALLFIFVRTVSYGIWTWKEKKPGGAVMVFILALTALVLPIFKLFFGG